MPSKRRDTRPAIPKHTPRPAAHPPTPPDLAAVALALSRSCDRDVISRVANADNGFEGEANANTLRRFLASGELPDDPSFAFRESLSLSRYADPETEYRACGLANAAQAHAARALAVTALLTLAARAQSDPSELIRDEDLYRLVASSLALGPTVSAATAHALAAIASQAEHFQTLAPFIALGCSILSAHDPKLPDQSLVDRFRLAQLLSDLHRRPRPARWCSSSQGQPPEDWVAPFKALTTHALLVQSERRSDAARTAASALAKAILGSTDTPSA
jgi:hypothetical protein